jgi:hypothetical protein
MKILHAVKSAVDPTNVLVAGNFLEGWIVIEREEKQKDLHEVWMCHQRYGGVGGGGGGEEEEEEEEKEEKERRRSSAASRWERLSFRSVGKNA